MDEASRANWITTEDLYDQGYTAEGAEQLFGEPTVSPDGTLGWDVDWINRVEERALIPVLPFLIERLRGHHEVGEPAGDLVRLYEDLNRRAGLQDWPDPLHHHEISEQELAAKVGTDDRDMLSKLYGSYSRTTIEQGSDGKDVTVRWWPRGRVDAYDKGLVKLAMTGGVPD